MHLGLWHRLCVVARAGLRGVFGTRALAFTLLVAACGTDPAPPTAPGGAAPAALQPTDGRPMGTARLDYEKCEAVLGQVRDSWTARLLSSRADDLASRLGPPDGVRPNGDRYWLAVSQSRECNEFVVSTDGSFGESSLRNAECGLPDAPKPSGPPAKRKPEGE